MSEDAMENLRQRIAELESRLEFSDQTIGQLNDELVVHQRAIADLRKQLQLVMKQLPDKGQLSHDPESEPPPPHY